MQPPRTLPGGATQQGSMLSDVICAWKGLSLLYGAFRVCSCLKGSSPCSLIEEKWRISHDKGSDTDYHRRTESARNYQSGQEMFSNFITGVCSLYFYEAFWEVLCCLISALSLSLFVCLSIKNTQNVITVTVSEIECEMSVTFKVGERQRRRM